MNHLAHLFLAGVSIESKIGNLSGDFVKGALGDRFTDGIRRGIMEHRRIDAFTDTHPVAGEFRRILIPEHGHYARVIADVFFDHFLAFFWRDYSATPLDEYLKRTFASLDPHVEAMPEGLRRVYPRMRDGAWFQSYAEFDGIWVALHYLSQRFSRSPTLELATHALVWKREPLENAFRRFFPDVIAYANALRSADEKRSGNVGPE